MLFNSIEFIFLFLPVIFIGYYILANLTTSKVSKLWLVVGSLFFYGYWNYHYLVLILFSICVNFCIGHFLLKFKQKLLIVIGLVFNLGLLGYYKYLDFVITNINAIFSTNLSLLNLLLPLAISFFTFQQISYLVDCYKGNVSKYSFLDYILYISFFPQLIAGPIVYHHELMPQFQDAAKLKLKFNFKNLALGIFIFSIGLFKKVILADHLSVVVLDGLQYLNIITFFDAWTVILSYTFQLYFDFSGYSDMAIGLALLFNIKLPINFNSPYKSTNFQVLMSRWHITLSRFLNDYVFNPMSSSLTKHVYSKLPFKVNSDVKISINLILLFLLSGIWHGAGWNYVIWGLLSGSYIVVYRFWRKTKIKFPTILAWGITFLCFNISVVFFRLEDLNQAVLILKAMFGLNGFILPEQLAPFMNILTHVGFTFEATPLKDKYRALALIVLSLVIVLAFKNSSEKLNMFKPTLLNVLFIIIILIYSIINLTNVSEFLYFNF